MASPALNQELQALILQSLEKQSSIADTSKLILPSAPGTPVDQQTVQAVLTSLASRNVDSLLTLFLYRILIVFSSRLSNSNNMNKIFGDLLPKEPPSQIMEVMKLVSLTQSPRVWKASR